MDMMTKQEDRFGETAQLVADFQSRLWEPEEEDKGGRLIAKIVAVAVVGIGLLAFFAL